MASTASRTVFNRFEIKYVISQATARAFTACLDGYTRVDEHADGDRGYIVCSTYWDAPDFAFFWEKVEGIKFRRKLRFRWYSGSSDEMYVEIKQRVNRTIQKRRVRWPADRLRAIFLGAGAADEACDDPVVSESLYLRSAFCLRPALTVAYRRAAYFGVAERDLRVTIDTDVRYHPADMEMRPDRGEGKYVIDPDLAIMEIKFNDRVPRWLCRLVSHFGLPVARMSKYCRAVDLEHFQGRLT